MCCLVAIAAYMTSVGADRVNGLLAVREVDGASLHDEQYLFDVSRSTPAKGSPLDVVAAPLPNKAEMLEMERDLAHKLNKMKELISGIHSGVDQSSKMRANAMKHKFNRLSNVIATLAGQKESLYKENVKLRKEMKSTVQKLLHVTAQLKQEAKRANDNDVKRWFDMKAGEITKFLHSNGKKKCTPQATSL